MNTFVFGILILLLAIMAINLYRGGRKALAVACFGVCIAIGGCWAEFHSLAGWATFYQEKALYDEGVLLYDELSNPGHPMWSWVYGPSRLAFQLIGIIVAGVALVADIRQQILRRKTARAKQNTMEDEIIIP